jgi:Protein of unknown function (DUF2490)
MSGYHLRAAIVIAVLVFPAAAQDRQLEQNFRVWFAYFGDHPFGDSRWGVHLEGQIRRQDGLADWQQLVLRPGVNYQANRFLMLSAGYAYVRSYPRDPLGLRNENRIWEQSLLRYSTGKVAWSSRYRFENRFIEETSGAYRFENRFRALQQATVPVSKHFYVTGYDEIFVWVPPYQASSLFDQNRAYAGLGFNIKPGWRFESAYMNQALLLRSGRALELNHILVFSVFSSAAFRRSP